MKIRTKLRLLIALYAFPPIIAVAATLWNSPLFLNQDFQAALVIAVSTALLLTLFGHFFGMGWLLMRQVKQVTGFCKALRNGDYAWMELPNEPINPEDENEMVALMRHMNWMANRIQVREADLKKALAIVEEKNLALKAANAEIEAARNALWGEMELAKKIQTALLPFAPVLSGYRVSARMAPADEVGGDYYDVISHDGNDWVLIGDVSGHGVPAGLIMMMAQTAVRTVLNKSTDIAPSRLLAVVNAVLTRNIHRLGESKYMTMTAVRIDPEGELVFAGLHQDLLIYRHAAQTVETVETEGMWLGIMEDIGGLSPDLRLRLAPGDCLLLYTDGVTEAVAENGAMLGAEGLIDLLAARGRHTPDDIRESVFSRLERYETDDDVTLLVLNYTGEIAAAGVDNRVCADGVGSGR